MLLFGGVWWSEEGVAGAPEGARRLTRRCVGLRAVFFLLFGTVWPL